MAVGIGEGEKVGIGDDGATDGTELGLKDGLIVGFEVGSNDGEGVGLTGGKT